MNHSCQPNVAARFEVRWAGAPARWFRWVRSLLVLPGLHTRLPLPQRSLAAAASPAPPPPPPPHDGPPRVTLLLLLQGGTLAVRTLEAVPAGEPLLHCYGPQVGEMTTAQRRAMLQQQYHFACACRACAAAASGGPAAALVDAAPAGLRCPAARGGSPPCEGAVLPAAVVPAGMLHRYALPSGSGACCSCGAPLSAVQWEQQVLPDLALAAEAYAGAMALLEAERQRGQAAVDGGRNSGSSAPAEAQQAIRTLRQCLRQRQQLLHPRSLLLGATHDALAHAWHLAGNAEAAAQHLRHSLAVLEHAYPPHSTAAAYQRQQLALALRLAAADAAAGGAGGAAGGLLDEARSAEEEADAVLEAHFGSRAAALEG